MGELVNLRLARKRKARDRKETVAAGNRASFGRTGAEKKRDAAEKARAEALVEGHRRTDKEG